MLHTNAVTSEGQYISFCVLYNVVSGNYSVQNSLQHLIIHKEYKIKT